MYGNAFNGLCMLFAFLTQIKSLKVHLSICPVLRAKQNQITEFRKMRQASWGSNFSQFRNRNICSVFVCSYKSLVDALEFWVQAIISG